MAAKHKRCQVDAALELEAGPATLTGLPTPTREAVRMTVEGESLIGEVLSFVQERYPDKKLDTSIVEAFACCY